MRARREYSTAERRLLFWLWTPYLSDAALSAIGIWLLLAGNDGGWWAIAFAGVRAVLGTAALIFALRSMRSSATAGNSPGAPRD